VSPLEFPTRKLRVSSEFLTQLGTRTNDGRRIIAEWGEPDAEGFYTPILTEVDTGFRLVNVETLAAALISSGAFVQFVKRDGMPDQHSAARRILAALP
jgi:hypothetical protein